MFAFAIVDGPRVFLARDRHGIKPFHYAVSTDGRALVFASEIKAILQSGLIEPSLDMAAFESFFVLGFPVGTGTFFGGIRTLPPGHSLRAEVRDTLYLSTPTSYATILAPGSVQVDLETAQTLLWDTMGDAMRRHLDADVKVGFTLSGGIDSTMLVLAATEYQATPLTTYTVADHEDHPDILQARMVARTIGATHIPVILNFESYLAAIPACVAGEETYCSLSGLPFHILSGIIAKDFKVCIHGEGADELFGGYQEYLDHGRKLSWLSDRILLARTRGIEVPAIALAAIAPIAAAQTFENYLESIFTYNLRDQLERLHLNPVDKSAMANSLEMRVPYLDDEVYNLVRGLPIDLLVRSDLGIRKYILRKLCLRRFGNHYADIVMRQKLGVPTSGIRFLDRFDKLCEATLPANYLERNKMARYFSSKRELFLFEVFYEIFCVHRGNAEAMGDIIAFMHSRARAA
jgi:asparagine synthase (glutamine-hydrolysing)